MLRSWLIGIGLAAVAIGVVILATTGFPPSIVFFCWGAILVLGIVYERFRYKPLETARPGAGWERTTERFIDDETGKPVTVYIQPETGERKYVEE
ncbi:MAG: hypothetical protein ABSC92_03350 [Rhizomicrobium sp.]|jgi:membrane protein implicated in regulation of membrane protease activity